MDQPCNHFAEQREVTDVVDVQVHRLRDQLSQLGLVSVLYSCEENLRFQLRLVRAEPEQSCSDPAQETESSVDGGAERA